MGDKFDNHGYYKREEESGMDKEIDKLVDSICCPKCNIVLDENLVCSECGYVKPKEVKEESRTEKGKAEDRIKSILRKLVCENCVDYEQTKHYDCGCKLLTYAMTIAVREINRATLSEVKGKIEGLQFAYVNGEKVVILAEIIKLIEGSNGKENRTI